MLHCPTPTMTLWDVPSWQLSFAGEMLSTNMLYTLSLPPTPLQCSESRKSAEQLMRKSEELFLPFHSKITHSSQSPKLMAWYFIFKEASGKENMRVEFAA